jgi:hypothetical protein
MATGAPEAAGMPQATSSAAREDPHTKKSGEIPQGVRDCTQSFAVSRGKTGLSRFDRYVA